MSFWESLTFDPAARVCLAGLPASLTLWGTSHNESHTEYAKGDRQ